MNPQNHRLFIVVLFVSSLIIVSQINAAPVFQITSISALQALSPAELAQQFRSAQALPLADVNGLAIEQINLTSEATFLDTLSFSPRATTEDEASAGVRYSSDPQRADQIPFRAYAGVSRIDTRPVLRLSYNFSPNDEPTRQSYDEVRVLSSGLVIAAHFSAQQVDAYGNPTVELEAAAYFWSVDLDSAGQWVEPAAVLGYPWATDVPASGTCPADWQPAFIVDASLYPFTDRCIELRFGTIHYFDEAPDNVPVGTVVMVHGNPVWSFVYRDIAKTLLAQGYRVIALDLYGFGLSDKPDLSVYSYTPHDHAQIVEHFVEALDLRDFTLVMQDWGGPIGLSMAGHMPSRIRNFVIMNTWAFAQEDSPWSALNRQNSERLTTRAIIPRSTGMTLASLYGEEGSEIYQRVRDAYWAPFIDVQTSDAYTDTVAAPTNIFAINVAADKAFLEDADINLQAFLVSKPVHFVYGPAEIDPDENRAAALYPEVLEEMLGGEAVDLSATIALYNLPAVESVNQAIYPLYRFLALWTPEQVIGVTLVANARHFIQEYAQDEIVAAVNSVNGQPE